MCTYCDEPVYDCSIEDAVRSISKECRKLAGDCIIYAKDKAYFVDFYRVSSIPFCSITRIKEISFCPQCGKKICKEQK